MAGLMKILSFCAALVWSMAALPVARAEIKIAVVDLQRALNETEDGQQAKARLQKVFKQKQDALDGKQKGLKKMKEEIDKQRNVLSPQALQQRMEDYQKQFVELQSVYMEYQKELAQKEGEATKDILDQMQVILRRIGQAEGYSLVVERNEGGVVWVPTHLDLTDRVIQAYNSERKKGGAPPGAAPANADKTKGKKK